MISTHMSMHKHYKTQHALTGSPRHPACSGPTPSGGLEWAMLDWHVPGLQQSCCPRSHSDTRDRYPHFGGGFTLAFRYPYILHGQILVPGSRRGGRARGFRARAGGAGRPRLLAPLPPLRRAPAWAARRFPRFPRSPGDWRGGGSAMLPAFPKWAPLRFPRTPGAVPLALGAAV